MSPTRPALRARLLDPSTRSDGLRFAFTVVAAYAASLATGLPGPSWAAMTALIVARADTASTRDAALDRTASTLLGASGGLLGATLVHLGAEPLSVTLAIVAILAYVGAAIAELRGAAMAALIVLTATGNEKSAMQVAVVRVMQITIGIAVTLAISRLSTSHRATDRVCRGCARILRGAALRLSQGRSQDSPSDAGGDVASSPARRVLGQLAVIAMSADRPPLLGRRTVKAGAGLHGRIVVLTTRVLEDVTMLARVLSPGEVATDDAVRPRCPRDTISALAHVADVIDGAARPDPSRLGPWCVDRPLDEAPSRPASLLAAPLHLLSRDLHRLCDAATSAPGARAGRLRSGAPSREPR